MSTTAHTWFVTGATSGFGRLLTERLLERGDRVVAAARHVERLADLVAEHPGSLHVARLDVTDERAVGRVVDEAFAWAGTLDVVVNSAGRGVFGAVEEVSGDQLREAIEVNLLGSASVISAALPHLRAQRGGRVLQISSAGGQTTYPSFGAYHAAKWGIEGLCETLAAEVAPFGIGVTIVEPGATATGFGDALDVAPAMEEYAGTPAAAVREAIEGGGFVFPNDPDRTVEAILDLVDSGETPLRLPLGVDAYDDVRASLVARLEEHDAARERALGVALSAGVG